MMSETPEERKTRLSIREASWTCTEMLREHIERVHKKGPQNQADFELLRALCGLVIAELENRALEKEQKKAVDLN